jgi:hypothetical protein
VAVAFISCALAVLCLLFYGTGEAGALAPKSVSLGEGHLGRYFWSTKLEAPEFPGERKAGYVCLSITMSEPEEGGSNVANCGPLRQDEVFLEMYRGGRKGRYRSVLSVLVDGRASTLLIKPRNRPAQRVTLKRLEGEELAGISSQVVPYFTRGYYGPLCIEAIAAYDAAGRRVAGARRLGCAS